MGRRKRTPGGPAVGRWSHKRGKVAEQRAHRAIGDRPPYPILSVRRSAPEEDYYKGVDLWVIMHSVIVPKIPVQVKSSWMNGRIFEIQHPDTCVIVAPPRMPYEVLREQAHRKIYEKYMYLMHLAGGTKPISESFNK